MSSYLLMGLPGLAYLCGVAEVGWTAIGLAIGTYLNWLIVAKRHAPVFSTAHRGHHRAQTSSPAATGTRSTCSPASPLWSS